MTITVIIPNLNRQTALEALLLQLNDSAFFDEIIVSDGGSNDDSLNIAIAHKARLACGGAGRGQQLARGARLARSDWLLFLHGDSVLDGPWQKSIAAHKKDFPAHAAYFKMAFDTKTPGAFWVERLVSLRARLFALPYGDQGLLISRKLYDEIGGYADIELFEDVEIIQKIGRGRLKRLEAKVITDSSDYKRDGFLRRGWRNMRLLRRYFKGETVSVLSQDYHGPIK